MKDWLNLESLPDNVLVNIAFNLDSQSRSRLCRTSKTLFRSFAPTLYSKVVYLPNTPGIDNVGQMGFTRGKDEVQGAVTFIDNHNIGQFLHTLHTGSVLGFSYSYLIVELYLEDWIAESNVDLVTWRNTLVPDSFPHLKAYTFPDNILIKPLTYTEAPNLDTLIIDRNFCLMVDENHGTVQFINYENVKKLFFKGQLGLNEDMTIFKLITSAPRTINCLCELHFLVDDPDNYNTVYRRLVGFCAILRKMNLPMPNLNSLTIPLTNQSSDSIISLLGKHIIFENLNSLTLLIQDDSGVLTLIKPIDKLGSIIRVHGLNIEKLSIKYHLTKSDEEKNHLRSMMLLKLCESFHKLKILKIELNINLMNLSNLLMIIGAPISNNLNTLRDIRLNIHRPSENLVANILPTLEDATMIFSKLNFIDSCSCSICQDIFMKLQEIKQRKLQEEHNNSFFGFGRFGRYNNIQPNREIFTQTIKVGTLLIVGQELDILQNGNSNKYNSYSNINHFKTNGWIRNHKYSSNGYLFDHLIRNQLDESFASLPFLRTFELCGLVYTRNSNNAFDLRYGGQFQGLSEESLLGIVDLGQMFIGSMH